MEEKDFNFHDEYSLGNGDYHNWSDNDLVAICREGSKDAYEPLVRRYSQDLYRMAYALVGNVEDAFDLTEQAFISEFPRLDSVGKSVSYSIVLFRSALEGSQKLLKGEGLFAAPDSGQGQEWEWRSTGAPSGFCSVEARRTRNGVEAALACLPTPEKLALVLRDIVGFSVEQAASVLRWPPHKIKAKLSSARLMIYRILHPESEANPDRKRCEQSQEFFSDYMEGQLHPKNHEQLAEHLNECRHCADSLKGLEETLAEVSVALNHKMPGDLWRSISVRLEAGDAVPPSRTIGRRRGLLWRLIAILSLSLSLAVGGGRLITKNLNVKAKPPAHHAVQQTGNSPRGAVPITTPQKR